MGGALVGVLAGAVVLGAVVLPLRVIHTGGADAVDGRAALPSDAPGMFVEDYLRRAVGQDHIRTSDPEEVAQFLQRELGLLLQPLAMRGLLLQGAEICLLDGRRGAMIVYRKGERTVSHYVVPRKGTPPRAPALTSTESSRTGPSTPAVVTWSTANVEQALVGGTSPEELLALARSAMGAG